MFSSDIARIRIAELKAAGDQGRIARLRKTCLDGAAIFDSAAVLLDGKPLRKEHRRILADGLRRGASLLRSVSGLNAPTKKRPAKGGK